MTRRNLTVLAVASIAAALACLFAAVQPSGYRGEVELVVGRGNAPLDPASRSDRGLAASLQELVKSRVLAQNVVDGLRLRESPSALLQKISVSIPQPAVLRISVTDRDRAQAERAAAEVGLVFTGLVQARFGARGSRDPLRATVWDPAHAERQGASARIVRDGLAAALLGALAALGLDNLPRRAKAPPALARVEPIRRPLPQPEPEPETEPELPPAAVVPLAGNPAGNVLALDRLVESRAADFPERAEEWRYYVAYLRDFAQPDGSLPDSLAGLVADVFAEVLPRAA